MMVKFRDQPVDLLIGPCVEKIRVGELWKGRFHCSDMLNGTLFDTVAVIRRKSGEPLLKCVDVEECDWKGADAAAGASEPAGNFTTQRSGCPLKPVVGFVIQRTRVWQGGA